ncbi:MAG: ABC transporter permease subunit [Candidatus Dormibacteraceae bacterium]
MEVAKLFGRPLFSVGLVVLAVVMALFYLLFFLFRSNIPASGTRFLYWPDSLIYGLGYASGYASWTSYGTYLLIVLVGVGTAQEYSWRTLQLWLGHGIGRRTVLCAKFAVSLIPAVAIVVACLVVVGAVSAVYSLADHGTVAVGKVHVDALLLSALRTLFSMLPYAALTFLIAVVTRSTVLAVAGGVGFVAVIETALLQTLPHLGGTLDRVVQFLPSGLSSALNGQNAAIAGAAPITAGDQPSALVAAIGIGIYTVILCGLALLVFERQDLTQA